MKDSELQIDRKSHVPVSYTHLDVYKRQARKIPPTAASVRKFRTEKAAQRYLDDNAKFFAKIAFQIEHIQNGGDAI